MASRRNRAGRDHWAAVSDRRSAGEDHTDPGGLEGEPDRAESGRDAGLSGDTVAPAGSPDRDFFDLVSVDPVVSEVLSFYPRRQTDCLAWLSFSELTGRLCSGRLCRA